MKQFNRKSTGKALRVWALALALLVALPIAVATKRTALAETGTEKGLFAARYSELQIFDCQRTSDPDAESISVSSFEIPYDAVASTAAEERTQFTAEQIENKVFYFKPTGNTEAPFSLWMADDVNKTNEQAVSVKGNIYGLSSTGYIYVSADAGRGSGLGYFISNAFGYAYGGSVTYTASKTGYITQADAEAYLGANTVPQEKTVKSIAVKTNPTKLAYTAGELFAPTGLELKVTYNDDSTDIVAYNSETQSDFAFEPTLTTGLEMSVTSVQVSYAGHTMTLEITVSEAVSSEAASSEAASSEAVSSEAVSSAAVSSEAVSSAAASSEAVSSKAPQTNAPQTGDNSVAATMVVLLIMSAASVAAVVIFRKKSAQSR